MEANLSSTQMLTRIELLEAEKEYWQGLAERDALTDLPNRLGLERRTHARDGWFVLADLNGFKKAQDAHPDGHAYGDRILQEFADWLESNCRTKSGRSEDRVASRLGGDEFVVWCPTRAAARRIKQSIRSWVSEDGRVTSSAGLGKTLDAADAAMYVSKHEHV